MRQVEKIHSQKQDHDTLMVWLQGFNLFNRLTATRSG
jgi:hypothetical protein